MCSNPTYSNCISGNNIKTTNKNCKPINANYKLLDMNKPFNSSCKQYSTNCKPLCKTLMPKNRKNCNNGNNNPYDPNLVTNKIDLVKRALSNTFNNQVTLNNLIKK